MSRNNPYATNGYGSSSNVNNGSNPYGANPYGGSNPYGNDPYANPPASAASLASANSQGSGSRGDAIRTQGQQSSSNPYGRQPPPRRDRDRPREVQRERSPAPQLSNPYDDPSQQRQRQRSRSPAANPYGSSERIPAQGAESGPSSAGAGYGGLGAPPAEPEHRPAKNGLVQRPRTPQDHRDNRDNRERPTRDRSQSQGDSRSRERRPPTQDRPPMPKPQSRSNVLRQQSPNRPVKTMDEILRHIQANWRIMEGDECTPVRVALQLADPSSLGLGDREQDFADTHTDLQRSLKSVVNEHYADFNSAVGTYHKIQASIRESQSRVRYLKTGLANVKGGMLTTRPELRGLAEQSGQLDDLLLTINQMEHLRDLPHKLEEKINEKRWIGAVDILGEALISSRKSGLDDIGAMADLKGYFASQESSLIDMLIEELHDHLYLKSPYCAERWKGRKVGGNDATESNPRDSFGGNAWDRPVYQFLAQLDTTKPMTPDLSKNPESDTFYYIQMIVEALNRRGYLEELVGRIEQRLPVELYKVVERTNQEIDAKNPSHLRTAGDTKKSKSVILQASETDSKILSDFLWTLYAKFEAIAEGHRVLHEVVLGVAKREKYPKSEQYGASFKELWKLYQMEIRSLLHDYLATDGEFSRSSGKRSIAASDVFARQPRDKNKRMFKLSELDEKSADLKAEEDDLDEILQNSVPGLVTKSKNKDGTSLLGDRGNQDGAIAGHKLLIEPSVFNMTILLPPSLTFLQHLKDIVPQTANIAMSTLTSFLDDFLINVFHPQLEEAVTDLCTENMVSLDTFMEDPQWTKHAPHPIFKGTVGFVSLITAFSSMLSAIPQDQMFTQLVITQLFKYYDRCYSFYKNIVSRVSHANQSGGIHTTIMKAAAGHAEEGEIKETSLAIWEDREAYRFAEIKKEINMLVAASKANPIQPYDIISDPKSVHQLALVYNSMQWLAASLQKLRHVEAGPSKTHARNTSLTSGHNQRRWTLITNTTPTVTPEIYLPLTSDTSVPFDETLHSFRGLAIKALLTLHLDIRCGIIHSLGQAMRPPDSSGSALPTPIDTGYPFVLSAPPTSASPMILDLNNDLIDFEASISKYLGTRERNFIVSGLGALVDRYLVVGADAVQLMNNFGAERMRVDGMVVQQVLRGLGVNAAQPSQPSGLGIDSVQDDEALLDTSNRYYELFLQGPDAIMKYVQDEKAKGTVGYTYDELRTLIELCFSAVLRSEDREETIKARKKMGDLLLQLGEIMWDS